MGICKNDCLDCANLEPISPFLKVDKFSRWKCNCGHKLEYNSDGLILVRDEDCKDFKYEE